MTVSKQVSNTRVLLSQVPEGIALNKSHFRTVVVNEDIPELKEGAVYVKNIIFSLDPYIKYNFLEGSEETPVGGFGIAKVIDSKNTNFPTGSTFFGPVRWGTFSVLDDPQELNESVNLDRGLDPEVPLSIYNGVLGLSGFTVWDSLNRVADLKKGEAIYISSAAGTLGQLAGQLAKRKGLRVIGSAGSDEKVQYLKTELGFDAAFNYKTTQDRRTALIEAAGEKGLDIYYDLLFDDTVDIALDLLNPHGRIIAVGAVALSQGQTPVAPKNMLNLLLKQLRYEGYVVYEYADQYEAFWKEMTPMVKNGEIKFSETVLQGALDVIPETYLRLLNGEYKGKVSVQVITSRFSTFTSSHAEIIDTLSGSEGSTSTTSSPPPPPPPPKQQQQPINVDSTKKSAPEPVNPFFAPLQAWIRDFKSNEPKDLIHLQRKVFGVPMRRDILHRVVIWQQDGMRQGTHSTKGRSEVSGTTRKAARQKGRGAARVGSLRAPQRRGGGIPFGPKPRDHSSELPRKVQEMGLRVALSAKFAQDQLVIVDGVELDSHKTREFEAIKNQHGWDSVLIIANQEDQKLWRATKNLQKVDVTIMQETDVLRLLKYEMVVMDRKSVKYLEKKLKV
ncbi:hypothetical protein BGZ65_005401 [Modicella reniformis]|uniref:Enoyl reductase (ER) domain-containing protein n=1 Tax=Modicella reniformis TaxID=1440133 RepID=A0A9P6MKQ0_9FUNG|nr:hypothetical protein BGZ65_005401 [Modicella reniformis]